MFCPRQAGGVVESVASPLEMQAMRRLFSRILLQSTILQVSPDVLQWMHSRFSTVLAGWLGTYHQHDEFYYYYQDPAYFAACECHLTCLSGSLCAGRSALIALSQ